MMKLKTNEIFTKRQRKKSEIKRIGQNKKYIYVKLKLIDEIKNK